MRLNFYQALKINLLFSIKASILIYILAICWLFLTLCLIQGLPADSVKIFLYHPAGGLGFWLSFLLALYIILRRPFNKTFTRKYKDFQLIFIRKKPSLNFYIKYCFLSAFFGFFVDWYSLGWKNLPLHQNLHTMLAPLTMPEQNITPTSWLGCFKNIVFVLSSFLIPALILIYLLDYRKEVFIEKKEEDVKPV